MKFEEQTKQLFQTAYERLKPFHSLLLSRTAIIAYSGGKDSTLLTRFYQYLSSQSKCPDPILFHLDHSIRDNYLQEREIQMEMERISKEAIVKKKTFQIFLNDLKKV